MKPSMVPAISLLCAALISCGSESSSDSAAPEPADTAPEEVTWESFAEDFFQTYCVSCHSPEGQASADFNDYDVVTARLNAIRCGVAPEQLDGCEGEHPPGWFPIGSGPFPSDDERWTLVEWIDAGAPRN